nr:hypothetical protein [Chryseobacterium antibioticum]
MKAIHNEQRQSCTANTAVTNHEDNNFESNSQLIEGDVTKTGRCD